MVQCTTFALSSYKVVRLIHKDCGKKPKYFVSSLLFKKKNFLYNIYSLLHASALFVTV